MNWGQISKNVGYALLVSALFMFLSILVSILHGNDSAAAALTISFTITFIVGIFPFIFVRGNPGISLKEGYVIITLAWFLSFVFGMLPYALWGGPFSLENAWFESVSGFTTTGSTILDNVEGLPPSLQFWRCSTHFIGGLGVVVFLLLIIHNSSPVRMRLTNLELNSLSRNAGTSSRPYKTMYNFALVYLGLCIVASLSYLLAGMKPLDAICHAMSVSATGGFSTRNCSIGAYDSRIIEGLTMLFMYLSSLNFGVLFLTIVSRSLKPLKNPVVRFYTAGVALVALVVGIGLKLSGICDGWGISIWNGYFQTLCVVTTSGFTILDNAAWPVWICMLLMLPAMICGCAGSTSGGIKADRALLFCKTVGRQIGRVLHPSSVNEIKLSGHVLRDEDVVPHLIYIALYATALFASALLCMCFGVNGHSSLAASLTSLSNVGPAIRELGTMGSFNGLPAVAKFIFTLDMFIGRIEIYPVLAVVGMLFDRRNR